MRSGGKIEEARSGPQAVRTPDSKAPAPDAAQWAEAQGQLAVPLARAAQAVGAFCERLRAGPEGAATRLCIWQAASITGTGADHLGLWRAGQVLAGQQETPAFRRATAVVNALESTDLPPADDTALHPLVRTGAAWGHWRAVHPAPEALARASRMAALSLDLRAPFVPVRAPGANGAADGPDALLAQWLAAVEAGCRAAMDELALLDAWQQRAEATIAGWSGRIPARLIAVIGTWPAVSAAMAEAESGASRAAVQRNLDRLAEGGLVRETTGQGRYRLWSAALG